jgi:osmotically-inducible protein OsmY
LAGKVKAALRAAPAVNDIHIDVHCENNNVVLTGLVEDERALLDAIRVATRAAQGHRVIDAISIMKNSPH